MNTNDEEIKGFFTAYLDVALKREREDYINGKSKEEIPIDIETVDAEKQVEFEQNYEAMILEKLKEFSGTRKERGKNLLDGYGEELEKAVSYLEESEKMSEQLEDAIARYGIQDQVEVDFNAQYVMLNMNGALLFDSGHAEIRSEAYPLIDKLGKLIEPYQDNIIEVEGHTDNVPIHSAKYEDNDVLSFYRARAVTDYLRDITTVEPAHLKASGRGEYVPVADNTTQEGRSRNRRVIIKIYNSYSSDFN